MPLKALIALLVAVALVAAVWAASRLISRRSPRPCPQSLIWLLRNPFSARYRQSVLSRLELAPGLRVLDAGCGPGLLTIPIARAVGPEGQVVALDIQAGMIKRARQAAQQGGVSNVEFCLGGLGEGKLPLGSFDRAVLVTVLGEISDRRAALREIYSSLKPGGFLSITEVLPDPDYQSRATVARLASEAGFRMRAEFGTWFSFTMNVERPPG